MGIRRRKEHTVLPRSGVKERHEAWIYCIEHNGVELMMPEEINASAGENFQTLLSTDGHVPCVDSLLRMETVLSTSD